MRVFRAIHELSACVGEDLGSSGWLTVDQERVDRFADVTGDHQWIHVDRTRALAGPFGATIVHGYLTLSLLPALGAEVFRFDLPGARLNYGADKVRFPSPVRTGSRVRVQVSVQGVETVGLGTRVALRYTLQVEGQSKPGCVADTLTLVVSEPAPSD